MTTIPVSAPSTQMEFNQLGERIRVARKARKMTQQMLADAAGIDSGGAMICQYEKGNSCPSGARIARLATALHISTESLWPGITVEAVAQEVFPTTEILAEGYSIDFLDEDDGYDLLDAGSFLTLYTAVRHAAKHHCTCIPEQRGTAPCMYHAALAEARIS